MKFKYFLSCMKIKYGLYYQYKLNKKSFALNLSLNVKLVRDIECIDTSKIKINKKELSLLLKNSMIDCFLYYAENIPVGIICACRGSYYLRGLGVPFDNKSDSCYIFWGYVSPQYRNKGILHELLACCCFHHSSCSSFVCLVKHDNIVMKEFLYKRLSAIVCKIFYMKVFNFSVFILSYDSFFSINYCIEYKIKNRFIII